MPEKDGAEEKSTKSVVNKKQKLGEEGYDIARDMGRVRPSKDKKDATTMPVSKEMRKTQKVNKGPSALDIVKKKYKGQIMDVGKKKVKEELDLTQVAEAFGGYVIESINKPKFYSSGTEKKFQGSVEGKKLRKTARKTAKSLRSGFDTVELENPKDKTKQSKLDQEAKKRAETGEQQSDKAFTSTKTDTTVNQKGMKVDDEGNIILNPPDQTPENIKRIKQTPEYQKDKKRGDKPLIDQDKFSSDTRTIDQDRVTRGSGDGRKAGRRGKTVTYSTFTKKPEVTGNVDAKDSGETVTYTTPDKRKKRSDAGQKRVKKDKVIVKEPETQIKTEPQTQTQMGDGEPPKPPKVGTSTGDSASGDTPQAFSSIKKFAKSNPQIAAAGALAGYDLGKGILSKIMKLRAPSVQGGRAIQVSAKQ